MAGHSKWANIKHRKGRVDAKRSKVFSKMAKEIVVAAKMGGPDPEMNSRLRLAISNAQAVNMPKENIQRAVKKGEGDQDTSSYVEQSYEGYGPSGTAFIIECLTDNKNRTTAEIRHCFSKYGCGGSMGESGTVAWMFDRKAIAVISVDQETEINEDMLFELIMEIDGEDVEDNDGSFTLVASPEQYHNLHVSLEKANIKFENLELAMVPNMSAPADAEVQEKAMNLMDHFEDLDDVQKVWTNTEFSEE